MFLPPKTWVPSASPKRGCQVFVSPRPWVSSVFCPHICECQVFLPPKLGCQLVLPPKTWVPSVFCPHKCECQVFLPPKLGCQLVLPPKNVDAKCFYPQKRGCSCKGANRVSIGAWYGIIGSGCFLCPRRVGLRRKTQLRRDDRLRRGLNSRPRSIGEVHFQSRWRAVVMKSVLIRPAVGVPGSSST